MPEVAWYTFEILGIGSNNKWKIQVLIDDRDILRYIHFFGNYNLCSLFFECESEKISERLEDDSDQDITQLIQFHTIRILRNARFVSMEPKEGIKLPINIKNNTIVHFYDEYKHRGIRPEDLDDIFDPLWRFLHISWIPDKK